jgi:hypothetical protein
MKKIGSAAPMDVAREAISALFPQHPRRQARFRDDESSEEIPGVFEDELERIAASTGGGKAPGPDGVPPEVIRTVLRVQGAFRPTFGSWTISMKGLSVR